MFVAAGIHRILITLLAIASIAGASVSACTCSHHQATTSEPPSCHGHSSMPGMTGMADDHEHAPISGTGFKAGDEDCVCATATPRAIAKADPLQFHKSLAVSTAAPDTKLAAAIVPAVAPRIDFEPPFYLTDSFHDLSPKRGPPVL